MLAVDRRPRPRRRAGAGARLVGGRGVGLNGGVSASRDSPADRSCPVVRVRTHPDLVVRRPRRRWHGDSRGLSRHQGHDDHGGCRSEGRVRGRRTRPVADAEESGPRRGSGYLEPSCTAEAAWRTRARVRRRRGLDRRVRVSTPPRVNGGPRTAPRTATWRRSLPCLPPRARKPPHVAGAVNRRDWGPPLGGLTKRTRQRSTRTKGPPRVAPSPVLRAMRGLRRVPCRPRRGATRSTRPTSNSGPGRRRVATRSDLPSRPAHWVPVFDRGSLWQRGGAPTRPTA